MVVTAKKREAAAKGVKIRREVITPSINSVRPTIPNPQFRSKVFTIITNSDITTNGFEPLNSSQGGMQAIRERVITSRIETARP
jgi:hypothetical protein